MSRQERNITFDQLARELDRAAALVRSQRGPISVITVYPSDAMEPGEVVVIAGREAFKELDRLNHIATNNGLKEVVNATGG